MAALYLNGQGEPAWYDGIIVDTMVRIYDRGRSDMYRIYFEEDEDDTWFTLPDDTVAYRHGSSVSRRFVAEVKARLSS